MLINACGYFCMAFKTPCVGNLVTQYMTFGTIRDAFEMGMGAGQIPG
jgi:hypothetical protein